MAEAGGILALAFTTYQSSKAFLIGSNRETKKLSIFERTVERPMGMAVS